MTLEDSIHASRVRVLREAERTGNVSATCRRHGVSRTVFYRLRRRFEQYGAEGVHPKRQRAAAGRPLALSVQTARRVIAFALAWPTSGPQWLSDQLARDGLTIAPVTVWRLLRRHQLGTRRARLAVLEQFSAATQGILTERTAQRDRRRTRHVAAATPGDLLSLDTFYVGKLKGVGKVWQITGCDAACSYAWARLVVGEVTAAAVLTFLREDVRPTYRRAHWRLQRVLTDNGKEFKGDFAAGCERMGLRITRTKPRHAWTNGFVERLQGTILHEHWRIAFRRQYFTGRVALQRSLDTFLEFTTTSAPTVGIGSRAARPRPFSGEQSPRDQSRSVEGCVNTITELDSPDETLRRSVSASTAGRVARRTKSEYNRLDVPPALSDAHGPLLAVRPMA